MLHALMKEPNSSFSPHFSPKARPKDQDAVNKYNQCNKIVHQQAFAKAIAVESSKKSVAESINLDTMGGCGHVMSHDFI